MIDSTTSWIEGFPEGFEYDLPDFLYRMDGELDVRNTLIYYLRGSNETYFA